MAETLTIEIPIEAVDRTGAGVQSATRNLTAFERAWDRTQRRLDRLERAHNIDIELDDNASQGLSRVSDQAESLDGVSPSVDVGVNNAATGTLSDVADQAATLDGTASDVEVGVDNNATGIIDDVGDSLTALNGNEAVVGLSADDSATMEIRDAGDALASLDGDVATVELTADDNATQAIRAAEDAAEMLDGTSATAELGADDNATPIVRAAEDAVENFSGSSGSAQLGADDNASPVIDSVRDKAAAWDGSVWTATVSVVDAATAPLTAIINAAKNPLTQAGAALGISVGLGDTVNTYKNFESMMSQVGAISGATGQAFEDLTAKAQEMGATTKFTATEAAEAFNYMAMAGWQPEQMISGISGIMNLAAASGESLGSTSDIVTDALTAFGLKASDSGHFADVLAKASASANTNVGMLGESFKYVAPVAGAMKYSVEDTSLALGLMANSSIKGSMAGTALKTSLANMAAPTDSMATAMEKYGISLTDSSGNMKTLKGVMDNLRGSLGGLSETEQTAAASTIFGKEAMAGMLAIINASEEDYNKLSDAIYNADGAAQDMSDTMLDNLEGSMTLMQSAVEGVQNSFGKRLTPYIRGVVDAITDATPAATAALTSLMDFVDGKAEGVKRTVKSMTNSEEWQNADLFGKVDIAWDTLIAEPFTKWAGSKGKHLLSKGLSNLFGEAAKIMPGGEKAGLTSWLSAGVIAKGATSLIGNAGNVVKALSPIGSAIKNIGLAAQTAPSVGAFVSDLGGMIPTAAKFGIAAAAITAAVVAIGVAIDNYNQKQINNSLADHFGSIELTAKQAEEAASGILNAKYLVNVDLALNEFKGADQLRQKAEEALQANQALTWKSSVGIELTADEQQEYKDNVTTFVESKISELESRTFAAHISVQTFLGGTEEGESLASSIEEWARADHLELTNLSNDLKTAVEEALKDGIIDVDEAQAVAELQNKMNSITSKWKQAEAQAQLDWINQEYGSQSGKDLTADSFTSVVEALAGQRETAAEETQALATEFYSYLNAAEASGRITARQNEHYKDLANQAIRNQKANDLMTSLNFENNTLSGTYGDLIATNQGKTQKSMGNEVDYLKNYLKNNDVQSLYDHLNTFGVDYAQQGGGWKWLQSGDQNALEKVWEAMKPDADSMRGLVDEYVKVGQDVPKQIMDKFNETMAIGAASGDTSAAWDVYAKSIADSGDKALIDAVSQMDANGQLGEEFSAAWKRATASVTDEPVELGDLKAEVDGVDIDKDAWVSSLNEKLGDLAETEDVTAEGATIKVKAGDCLWEIGNALGIDWQTIAEENGIESPYIIHAGDELKISMDNLTAEVDGDAAKTAIDQAMSALTAEGAEFSVTADGVKVDLANVQVDSETAMAQIEAALGMETGTLSGAGISVESGATVTIPSDLVQVDTSGIEAAVEQSTASGSEDTTVEKQVNVTTTAGSTDTTPVEQAAQAALSSESSTTDTTMTTNVTVEAGSTDATPAATSAQTELDNTFSNTMQTNGSADVTIEKASDNIADVYSQVGSELQAAFNSPYSARASVNVTVDYHITNPTASLSTHSNGSSVSVSIAGHANGGEVGLHGAELSWLGEEGKEYVIPTVPGRRGRGIALWQQAGEDLGVLDSNGEIAAHANGGIVGPGGEELASNAILPMAAQPQDENKSVWSVTGQELTGGTSEDNSEGQKAVSVNAAVQGQQGNNTFEINVDMNPVIKIEGGNMDEEKVFEVMKNRIREMADDLGDEIAERMSKIFANMPLVQEA
ncbi:phage tail tape measure protein [Fusicatenibacter saccharivorans]|uniref:phage tail tape measure protein n=1 Tax=Fusicatenibacter saccharivorans TaxID=1150298 RepID=UPI002ED36062